MILALGKYNGSNKQKSKAEVWPCLVGIYREVNLLTMKEVKGCFAEEEEVVVVVVLY